MKEYKKEFFSNAHNTTEETPQKEKRQRDYTGARKHTMEKSKPITTANVNPDRESI